ncbi:MAG: hypothetical protein EOP84_16975 [Verrucomicrobiaceae bacterium]|nr:MAG: hypothetical protein EOP84_16975 [Verrucomicrobiaceae bacterium]
MRRKLAETEQSHALERERARIARDIHDELGASLTRITLLSQNRGDAGAAQKTLEEIQTTAREVTRAMDEVVWAVNPQNDTVEGLVTYLHAFAQRFLATASIRCRFNLPMETNTRKLGAGVRHQIFLAFKECLHNIVKHSGATEVQVRMAVSPCSLIVEVADNGCGLATKASTGKPPEGNSDRIKNGHGLTSMCARLAEIGGTCEILPRQEGGTLVLFTIPFAVRQPVERSVNRGDGFGKSFFTS